MAFAESLCPADREIHLKLAELTRAGLPTGPLGEFAFGYPR